MPHMLRNSILMILLFYRTFLSSLKAEKCVKFYFFNVKPQNLTSSRNSSGLQSHCFLCWQWWQVPGGQIFSNGADIFHVDFLKENTFGFASKKLDDVGVCFPVPGDHSENSSYYILGRTHPIILLACPTIIFPKHSLLF